MLVTRYLFKNLFGATVFIALTLTLVIWLTQSLKLLELIADSDAPPALFVKLVALTLPKFLENILPLSLVIAVIFTYNKLTMDNEIIVMRAAGVTQYALARPAISLAVAISLALTFIGAWVSPYCLTEMYKLRQTIKTQYSAFLLREGVFNTFGEGLTIYLRSRKDDGDMTGLMIYDARDKEKPPVTVIARKGHIEMNGDTPNIVVFDGMRQQTDADSGNLSKLYFSRYTIEIKGLGGSATERWRDPDERTLPELMNPDMTNKHDRSSAGAFLAEAHSRIAVPWNALSFTLIALSVMLLGPFNRRGHHLKAGGAVGVIVLMQVLSLALINISKKHAGAIPLLYAAALIPVLLSLFLLHLRGEQALMALLRRWNARHAETAAGAGARA